jgi:Ni,Fe-hydrogenase III large subunit/Ni,Fe-hydrogenase III component G
MEFIALKKQARRLSGPLPTYTLTVNAEQYRQSAATVHAGGGRLVALWASDRRELQAGFVVHAALVDQDGLWWLALPINEGRPVFPDLSDLFPAASRMQRAVYDLVGLRADRAADERPWLRHDAWPAHAYPLRGGFVTPAETAVDPHGYPFISVQGEGVHEIPVGPVHAGIIEPGHFRFSVVGERVLRLEERLGYVHKGIEKRFESLSLEEAVRLAGRISGDSTVAYAWAYAMAVEAATATAVPERASWLRALLLERERLMNHLGDLGALANDAALAFGLAQFSRLKEDMLRLNNTHFGHRYLMDCVMPGGVVHDLDVEAIRAIRREVEALRGEIVVLKHIYDEHPGLQDRFLGTGQLVPALAAKLGLTGLAGRASGQAWDLRVQFPITPYDRLGVNMTTHRNGDVAARVTVRFEETLESLRLMAKMLDDMPGGEFQISLNAVSDAALGIGWVEGWRGEVLVAIEAGEGNRIHRCHAHDPSWQNWPALEYAVIGNIVPDFPLINKSFNLSYSGHDL